MFNKKYLLTVRCSASEDVIKTQNCLILHNVRDVLNNPSEC